MALTGDNTAGDQTNENVVVARSSDPATGDSIAIAEALQSPTHLSSQTATTKGDNKAGDQANTNVAAADAENSATSTDPANARARSRSDAIATRPRRRATRTRSSRRTATTPRATS